MFCPIQFSGISQISREKGRSSLKISARFWTTLVLLCPDCVAEGAIVPFARREQEACASFSCAFHLEKDTRVVRYPCPFILSTQKRPRGIEGATGRGQLPTWRKEDTGEERGEKEKKARLSRKLPLRLYGPEERVIPFNRGDWIFPRRGELLAQGAHGSADSPRSPPSARNPHPGSRCSPPPSRSPSHQPQPARHHPPVSRGQQFRSRDGELPVATARRDGGARTPQPRWNWPAPRRCRR